MQKGYIPSNTDTTSGLNVATGALQAYEGLKQGGVAGYGNTAVGAMRAGSGLADLAGDSSLASSLGDAAGYVAAPLAVYNAVSNWKSGSTASDALNGAAAGASIGSIVPGIGTLIGGIVGGAVGAVSSAFGPGEMDPENVNWNNYAAAYDHNPTSVQGATPAQNFQSLAGIFDSRGTNIPFYGKYGRMGENQFMLGMTNQINSALKSGAISAHATPSQIYSQIVQPWINGMSSGGWQQTYTSKGAAEKNAVGNVLTNLISQWQTGALTANSKVGVDGQTINGLPGFGSTPTSGASAPSTTAFSPSASRYFRSGALSRLAYA